MAATAVLIELTAHEIATRRPRPASGSVAGLVCFLFGKPTMSGHRILRGRGTRHTVEGIAAGWHSR